MLIAFVVLGLAICASACYLNMLQILVFTAVITLHVCGFTPAFTTIKILFLPCAFSVHKLRSLTRFMLFPSGHVEN